MSLSPDLERETHVLWNFLQSRDLSENEACAVMGAAITMLLTGDPREQMRFLQALIGNFGRANDKESECH